MTKEDQRRRDGLDRAEPGRSCPLCHRRNAKWSRLCRGRNIHLAFKPSMEKNGSSQPSLR
jgi:hypothetical protein